MKLLLIGATGRTGRHVISQALGRGHDVIAFVRRKGSLDSHERLQAVIGDPRDADAIASCLGGSEAVVSCLGHRSSRDASLLQDAAIATVSAMQRESEQQLLVVSQGLLFPSPNPLVMLLKLFLARHVADSTAMEEVVRARATAWTIVRPPRLLDGGSKRGYRIEVGARPRGPAYMQRADLAAFLLDAAERREHLEEVVGIASG